MVPPTMTYPAPDQVSRESRLLLNFLAYKRATHYIPGSMVTLSTHRDLRQVSRRQLIWGGNPLDYRVITSPSRMSPSAFRLYSTTILRTNVT